MFFCSFDAAVYDKVINMLQRQQCNVCNISVPGTEDLDGVLSERVVKFLGKKTQTRGESL